MAEKHPIANFWQELLMHSKNSSYSLARIYMAYQQKEAEKVPGGWRGFYMNVANQSNGMNLLIGPNIRRSSVSIVNNGPGIVLLSHRDNDPNALSARYAAGRYGEVMDFMPLGVNGSTTINSTGAVFACVTTSGTYAAVSAIESLFKGWQGGAAQAVGVPGASAKDRDPEMAR